MAIDVERRDSVLPNTTNVANNQDNINLTQRRRTTLKPRSNLSEGGVEGPHE